MNPMLFTEPLSLSRGEISPKSQGSLFLNRADYCVVVKEDWGWASCPELDAFIILSTPETDILIVEPANSEGYIKFDDWKSSNLDEEIEAIEQGLEDNLKGQSDRLGMTIEFSGWRVYPTLNEDLNVMYYATDINFGGELSTNVKASLFDRRGYVTFMMVPISPDLSGPEIERLVIENLDLYEPQQTERYTSFVGGDKVAAVGAVGVLATLVGVKYGKAAATGMLVAILLVLKKGAFLLLLPVLWLFGKLRNLFGGRGDT